MHKFYNGKYHEKISSVTVDENAKLHFVLNGKIYAHIDNEVYNFDTITSLSNGQNYLSLSRDKRQLLTPFDESVKRNISDFINETSSASKVIRKQIEDDFFPWFMCIMQFIADEKISNIDDVRVLDDFTPKFAKNYHSIYDNDDVCEYRAEKGIITINVCRYSSIDVLDIRKRYKKLGQQNGVMCDNIYFKFMDVNFGWIGGAPK